MVRMEALRNLPSRGGGFTRVGFGLESHASEAVASPSCHGTDPLDSSHDLPGVVYDSAGNLRTYVCDHNAAPPAHQYITTDKTNVLIRALTQRRSKDVLAGRATAGASTIGAARPGSSGPSRPKGPPGFENRTAKRVETDARRPATTGLERAAKRPTLADSKTIGPSAASEPIGNRASGVGGGADSFRDDSTRLDSLDVHQLRALLRRRGARGAAVDIASKAQLLAQARLWSSTPSFAPESSVVGSSGVGGLRGEPFGTRRGGF